MARLLRASLLTAIVLAVAVIAGACGTQRIDVPRSDPNYSADSQAAVLFSQRCAGCHTLSVAGTHGSGQNPRTFEKINGPNFDERCERPAIRVLYAIENGGFSGWQMPQNIVVGAQAHELATFVSRFAGSKAVYEPGSNQLRCKDQSIGSLPAATASRSSATSTAASVKATKTQAGTILVGSNGFTLYLFTADSKNTDVCVERSGCAAVWPPYTVTAKPVAGTGVEASLLGTIKLSSGKLQVTYNGHPLYLYAGDSSAAATDYIGVNANGGRWYGVSASGAAVK